MFEAQPATEELMLLPHVLFQVPEEDKGRQVGAPWALVLQQLPGETPGAPTSGTQDCGAKRPWHPHSPGSVPLQSPWGQEQDRCRPLPSATQPLHQTVSGPACTEQGRRAGAGPHSGSLTPTPGRHDRSHTEGWGQKPQL